MTRLFKQISIAILILLASSASATSKPKEPKIKTDGYNGFTVGIMNTNLSTLNSAMNAAGYGSFDNTQPFYGCMGYGIIKDRVMLGYWSGFNGQSTESQLNKAKLHTGVGFGNVGYSVINATHYKLIPFIGVGAGGYILNLSPIEQGSPEIHDVLTDPRRTACMTTGYIALELGLNNHFSFNVFDKLEDDEIKTFRIGGNVRMGILYPVARCDWDFMDFGEFGEFGDRDDTFKGPGTASKPALYVSLSVLFGNSTAKAPGEKDKAANPGTTENPESVSPETPNPEPGQ